MNQATRTNIKGCEVFEVTEGDVRKVVAWLLGHEVKPAIVAEDSRWLLAHCDDGITWGQLEHGTWRFSSTPFPELSPKIDTTGINVQQLRVFGPTEELLLWRTNGILQGRRLTDSRNSEKDDWFDEPLMLLGDRKVDVRGGFTHVTDTSGRMQVLPLTFTGGDNAWARRLDVRNYFEHDIETGVLRVAASRLMNLRPKKEDE